MRIQIASIAMGIFLAAQSAYPADVAYRLDENNLPSCEPSIAAKPAKSVLVNREWAPGVEESMGRYDLRPFEVSECESPELPQPFSLTLKGREWLAKGVETGTGRSREATQFQAGGSTQGSELTADQVFQVSYGRSFRLGVTAPRGWLAKSAWPCTQEMFSSIEERQALIQLYATMGAGYVF